MREWFLSNADRRDKLLACGALIVAELRMEVLKKTEFTCSAGIAHNKASGSISIFFETCVSILSMYIPFSAYTQNCAPLRTLTVYLYDVNRCLLN